MKKLLKLALAGVLSFGLVACGSDEPEEPVEQEQETETETANIIQVPVTLVNSTGVELHSLYLSGANREEWGDNLIDGVVLGNGEQIELTLNVDKTSLEWDLSVEDSEGVALEFRNINISEMSTEGFFMELLWDGEQGTCNLNNY